VTGSTGVPTFISATVRSAKSGLACATAANLSSTAATRPSLSPARYTARPTSFPDREQPADAARPAVAAVARN
jgi:hypothetical protein